MSSTWIDAPKPQTIEFVSCGASPTVDFVSVNLQVAGDPSNRTEKVARDSIRTFISRCEERRTSLCSMMGVSYLLKNITYTPGITKMGKAILQIELLAPSTAGNIFELPVHFYGLSAIKFGVFHINFRSLKVRVKAGMTGSFAECVRLNVGQFFTPERRKLRLSNLLDHLPNIDFIDDPHLLICQLRLSSQERKELHQKWTSRKG